MRTIAAIAAAAVAACLSAAPADAAFQYRSAKFKLEIEGVQTNSWSQSHAKQGPCDFDVKGQGTEVVHFRSIPAVVDIAQFMGTTPLIKVGKRYGVPFDLDAKITRRGVLTMANGEVCSSGDGTGGKTPPAPDCGTKRSRFYADLRYSSRAKDLLLMDQSLVVPLGTFRNCPSGPGSWPSILDRANSREVGQRLPVRDLFGPNRKHIVLVAARESRTAGDTHHTTTIRYSIALTRIGEVRR
jgi:hypothetical protein